MGSSASSRSNGGENASEFVPSVIYTVAVFIGCFVQIEETLPVYYWGTKFQSLVKFIRCANKSTIFFMWKVIHLFIKEVKSHWCTYVHMDTCEKT